MSILEYSVLPDRDRGNDLFFGVKYFKCFMHNYFFVCALGLCRNYLLNASKICCLVTKAFATWVFHTIFTDKHNSVSVHDRKQSLIYISLLLTSLSS